MKDKCDKLIHTMGKLSDYDNDSLTHFGIMGMHWGKRKVRYLYTTTGAKQDAKDAKNDAKDAARRAKKGEKMYRKAVAETDKWQASVANRIAKREASQKKESDKIKADKKFDIDVDTEVDNILSERKTFDKKYEAFKVARDNEHAKVEEQRVKTKESMAKYNAEDQARSDDSAKKYEAFKVARDNEHAKVEEQRVKTKESMAKYMAKYNAKDNTKDNAKDKDRKDQARSDAITKEISDKIDNHNAEQTKQKVQDSIKKLDEEPYKYNTERSGPILSTDEVNRYKSEKDNTGLVVRNNNGGNNNGGNNNGGNNNGGNNNGGNNRHRKQHDPVNKEEQEQNKKEKAEKSIDRIKVIGASGTVAKNTVVLGQTIVKNKFEADNKKRSSQMSDEELRNAATRMELENRYMNAKGIQDGKSKVNSVLTTIGSAIGVATSAAVMYETIKKMTG